MSECRIAVGTGNKCKLAAVAAVKLKHSLLTNYVISSHKVESGIQDQPDNLEMTIEGAQNRARSSWQEANVQELEKNTEHTTTIIALGIESGLFFTKSNRCYDVCVCSSTNDGITFNEGMSCAFEIPPPVVRYVMLGQDLSQASNAAGLTNNENLGEAEGLIGILSGGRITRQDYTEQSVLTSLMWLGNEELYKRE